MIIPVGAPVVQGSRPLRRGSVPHAEKDPAQEGPEHQVGDEGGFAPSLPTMRSHQADHSGIEEAGYEQARRSPSASIAPRPRSTRTASSEWKAKALSLTATEFTNLLATWCDKYPIISIEDAMHEGDWDGWAILTAETGQESANWSATTCMSPTPRILKEGISKGIAIRS